MASLNLRQASPGHSPYRDFVHLKKVNRQTKLEAPIKAGVCFAIALLLYADIYHISFINRVFNLPEFVDYLKSGVSALLILISAGHLASLAYTHLKPDREIEDSRAKLLNISKDDIGFKIKAATPRRSGSHSQNIEYMPTGSFCLPSAQNSFNESYNNVSVVSTSWQFQDSHRVATSPNYEKLISKSRYPNSRALDWHIEDEKSADAYLQERSREQSLFGGVNEDLGNLSFSPKKASVIDSGVEAIQRLFQSQPYKAASPSHIEKDKTTESSSAVICRRWHIDERQLYKWNEELRFWFHREVFVPLSEKISEINKLISDFGFGKDNLIGVGSTPQLRHLGQLKGSLLPGLENIVPYLEITINQQYIVGRIRDFCKGGALSEFNWNRGGPSWNDQLPSDAEIIMHAFCTYIDSRLTADPEFPDGRQFTKLHMKNSIGESRIETKGCIQKVLIHHTKKLPVHYLLQINEDIVDVGSGSNNALHTIILFLYYHKLKNESRICRMSMSVCGLDLLRIIS